VQHCAGSAPVPRERFARLHAATARERQTGRASPTAPAGFPWPPLEPTVHEAVARLVGLREPAPG
jgi:hypothetical protein